MGPASATWYVFRQQLSNELALVVATGTSSLIDLHSASTAQRHLVSCLQQAPAGVTKVLHLALATLSLKGGAATGGAILQGLLVTGPATYYAAALQLAITGEEAQGREAAVAALEQIPVQTLPLSVVLDGLLQVSVH